jgi:hypothetical protein
MTESDTSVHSTQPVPPKATNGRTATIAFLAVVVSSQFVIGFATRSGADEVSDHSTQLLTFFGYALVLLTVIFFLMRLPQMLDGRKLARSHPAARVYPILSNTTIAGVVKKLGSSGLLATGSPLTTWSSVVATDSNLTLWPTGSGRTPTVIEWALVERIEMGFAMDQGKRYSAIFVVLAGFDEPLPLFILGRGPFGLFGETKRRLALLIADFDALRLASRSTQLPLS